MLLVHHGAMRANQSQHISADQAICQMNYVAFVYYTNHHQLVCPDQTFLLGLACTLWMYAKAVSYTQFVEGDIPL